jgi:tetratricopeptide (TPR) repeat protein
VNAQIEKTRNFNFETEDPAVLLARLKEMEENRENRPFLDKIYFQIAEYYNHIDSTNVATSYYNKSLREPSKDNYLISLNYETLGNINFDKALYREASAYYDSTLTKIPNTSRDYFFVERKRDNLKEVIFYESIVQKNDSILGFVEMPEDERVDYFTRYAEELKEKAEQIGVVSDYLYATVGSLKDSLTADLEEEDKTNYESMDRADKMDNLFFASGRVSPRGEEFVGAIDKYRKDVLAVLGDNYPEIKRKIVNVLRLRKYILFF